jgi:hypothetical protein
MTGVSQAEFARIIGNHRSHVTNLKKAGRLVLTSDGKVDAEASKKRIAETNDPGKEHIVQRHAESRGSDQPKQQGSDAIGNSYQTARAVKEKYAALTAKSDYERAIGKLIDRDDVYEAMDEVVAFARQGLENLPHRVNSQLEGKDFEQRMAILKQEIVSIMSDMHKEAINRRTELTKVEV